MATIDPTCSQIRFRNPQSQSCAWFDFKEREKVPIIDWDWSRPNQSYDSIDPVPNQFQIIFLHLTQRASTPLSLPIFSSTQKWMKKNDWEMIGPWWVNRITRKAIPIESQSLIGANNLKIMISLFLIRLGAHDLQMIRLGRASLVPTTVPISIYTSCLMIYLNNCPIYLKNLVKKAFWGALISDFWPKSARIKKLLYWPPTIYPPLRIKMTILFQFSDF